MTYPPSFSCGLGGGCFGLSGEGWVDPYSLMTLFRKEVKGTLFGNSNPTYDIPKILDLYRSGDVRLDELITRTYTLEEVNQGYDDLLAGKNIRGVIVHDTA